MSITKVSINDFLDLAKKHPVLDVRSPGEYLHGHIPEAHSFPLFSDEERKLVGTAYKQESQQKAIKIGLDFFGKKMVEMVEEADKISAAHDADRTLLVHCWRGGMRSAGVAWLLDLYGFKIYTLVGGYKSYRNWALKQFEKDYKIHLIGGYTGSAKTVLLHKLQQSGESVIDLESLAKHKGSAFGNLGQVTQPSQEMFENELATKLSSIPNPAINPVWVEDECQRMGLINIPGAFLKTMHRHQLFFIEIPFEERLNQLLIDYGNCEADQLSAAIVRIKKRLGGLEMKNALQYLQEKNLKECFRILLKYYDKSYKKALAAWDNLPQPITKLENETVDPDKLVSTILQTASVNDE